MGIDVTRLGLSAAPLCASLAWFPASAHADHEEPAAASTLVVIEPGAMLMEANAFEGNIDAMWLPMLWGLGQLGGRDDAGTRRACTRVRARRNERHRARRADRADPRRRPLPLGPLSGHGDPELD